MRHTSPTHLAYSVGNASFIHSFKQTNKHKILHRGPEWAALSCAQCRPVQRCPSLLLPLQPSRACCNKTHPLAWLLLVEAAAHARVKSVMLAKGFPEWGYVHRQSWARKSCCRVRSEVDVKTCNQCGMHVGIGRAMVQILCLCSSITYLVLKDWKKCNKNNNKIWSLGRK